MKRYTFRARFWQAYTAAALLAVGAVALASCPAKAAEPLLIRHDGGGSVLAYSQRADDLAASGRPVVLDGPCMSACTFMLMRVRHQACMTRNASLHVHSIRDAKTGRPTFTAQGQRLFVIEREYPADFRAWVEAKGGAPDEGWLVADFWTLRPFLRTCRGAELRAAAR